MIKVLQIEDCHDYILMFKGVTRKHFEITVVTSLSELKKMSIAQIKSFNLIVCDGQLPDGTGMEAINFVKLITVSPIIANSSSEKYNQAMKESGANFCLLKKDLLATKEEFIEYCLGQCSL